MGRADRVGVVDDGGPAGLVASDGERQGEGEEQRDDAEHRRLQDAEGLAEGFPPAAQMAAGGEARDGGARRWPRRG
jgi:hypothetical protein